MLGWSKPLRSLANSSLSSEPHVTVRYIHSCSQCHLPLRHNTGRIIIEGMYWCPSCVYSTEYPGWQGNQTIPPPQAEQLPLFR